MLSNRPNAPVKFREMDERKKSKVRVIDLDERTRKQMAAFDKRLQKQVGAFDKRLLRYGSKDALKELSGQINKDALKGLSGRLELRTQRPDGRAAGLLKDFANIGAEWEAQAAEATARLGEHARAEARRKGQEIARQEAMVRYLADLRASSERAEQREAAAHERARQAEEREQVAITRSERIQRRSLWIAAAALVLTVISTTAAVLTLFS